MSPDESANVVVLVHGGTLTSTMWDPVRSAMSSPSLAVDLPGRRYKPADLAEVTIGDWVSSVVADIEEAGCTEVVLVGHSSGGYVLPGVAAALAARSAPVLRGLVFVSATVPADGERPLDYLREDIRTLASDHRELTLDSARGRTIGGLRPGEPPIETNLEIVENGPRMGLEAPLVLFEPVSWTGFPAEVPRVYVRALRDKVIPPELADRMIAANSAGWVSYERCPASRSITVAPPMAAIIDECCADVP